MKHISNNIDNKTVEQAQERISVMLISRCCGKGLREVQQLLKRLKAAKIPHLFHKSHPIAAKKILERYGFTPSIREPQVYVNDILFPAKALRDAKYIDSIMFQLQLVDRNSGHSQNHISTDFPARNTNSPNRNTDISTDNIELNTSIISHNNTNAPNDLPHDKPHDKPTLNTDDTQMIHNNTSSLPFTEKIITQDSFKNNMEKK